MKDTKAQLLATILTGGILYFVRPRTQSVVLGRVYRPGSKADDRHQARPARPSERIRGSKKNVKGSASTKGASITFGPKTIKALKRKVKEHNLSVGNDSTKRTTLTALKKVYRRGSGAFSKSHRPGMQRAQWAYARVNHFLHLLKTGRPKDPKYIQDNDLLPKGHRAK